MYDIGIKFDILYDIWGLTPISGQGLFQKASISSRQEYKLGGKSAQIYAKVKFIFYHYSKVNLLL